MILKHTLMRIAPYRANALHDLVNWEILYLVGKMKGIFLFALVLVCHRGETVEEGKKQILSANWGYQVEDLIAPTVNTFISLLVESV